MHIFCQTRQFLFDEIQHNEEVFFRVSNLMQDHKGFVWFRTEGYRGIIRYDGYEFVRFLDAAGDFNSIMEDKRGMLWLGSSAGITVFNPETEQYVQYQPEPATSQANSLNNVVKILEDQRGIIWCATGDGLLRLEFSPDTGSSAEEALFATGLISVFDISALRLISEDSLGIMNQINEIYEDSQQRLWIGGNGYLILLDSRMKEYTRLDLDASGRSRLGSPFITSIVEENENVFWVGTGDGLYRISHIQEALSATGFLPNRLVFNQYLEMILIRGLLLDNRNRLWIGTNMNGLLQMNYNDKGLPEFNAAYTDLNEPQGEDRRTILSMMKDETGLIWTGHEYGGILKIDPEGNYFASYDQIIRQNFTYYNVNSIVKDNADNLWIGTLGGGLHKIESTGIVNNYAIVDDSIPDQFGNAAISLLEIEDGLFWIGAANGIWQFEAKTGRSRKLFTQTRFGEIGDFIYDMLKIDRFILFSLHGQGLFVYDLTTGALKQYGYEQDNPSGLRSDIIYAICEANNHDIYVGGSMGLNRLALNKATGNISFLPVPVPEGVADTLGKVNEIYEDSEGSLWCGTEKGLIRLNAHTGKIQSWATMEGLSFDVINSIEGDGRGNIWLGTTNGLSMLDPREGKIKVFSKSDGLPVMIHNRHSSFTDDQGCLYFGGIGGFYSFYPDSIRRNAVVPNVSVTEFRLFNKVIRPGSSRKAVIKTNIAYTKEIKLRYNQNDLSFSFAVLDFNDPSRNRYEYRLAGYQKEWLETGADNRTATYTNLNPGEYTFMVRGSNNDELWNEEGTSISILIRPPFWKTTLAYIGYGIMFLLLLRGYIFMRTHKLRKEKIILEKQVEERTEELQEVNTLLEEQKEELLHQKEELQVTLENLRKTQEQLVESEKMAALGSLVAGVAHEINTPVGVGITAITSLISDVEKMADLFKKEELSKEDFKEFLQNSHDTGMLIQKNMERTAQLVQSFKQVSADQVSEQKRKFALKEYIYDILSSLKPKFREKQIDFHVQCDEKFEIYSYPGVYAQILTNLLLNSLQHGFCDRDSGVVKIQVKMDEAGLKITYIDNGSGINQNDLPHIFEPFYTSDKRKGTGLGLNIVYNLIRQKLQGNISCASEPGKGTWFTIEIPAA